MVLEQAFVDAEIKLALYYSSIRDKIGALNVAVVGFSFTVFERVSDIKTEFFFFLIALGVFSFIGSLRSSISYNYHFRNYEEYMKSTLKDPVDFEVLSQKHRLLYQADKSKYACVTLGLSHIPTEFFWSFSIGLICPAVAVFVYHPW